MNEKWHTGQWRKSIYSGMGGDECVEVRLAEDAVEMRDSKDPDGPVLTFDQDSWSNFVGWIKRGTR